MMVPVEAQPSRTWELHLDGSFAEAKTTGNAFNRWCSRVVSLRIRYRGLFLR
jgi:hypothetical protein